MEAANLSRKKFRELVQILYSQCQNCPEQRESELIVLPCIHVVCKSCAQLANQQAIAESNLPEDQRTKYHDRRRFECPICVWPQYRPLGSDDFSTYPSKLPLHSELQALGDNTPVTVVNIGSKVQKPDPHGYETRQGNYVYESEIGEYGRDCSSGQMTSITGIAVDEHISAHPLVIVCENKMQFILSFHLHGKLEQARKVDIKLWDICIGEYGTVIASVAEKDYALAKWDSALTRNPIRHENLFRGIYGHHAQISSEPFGVARDSQGRFLVTMLARDRVCRWDERRAGDHLYWFGDSGEGGTRLSGPYYLAKMTNGLTVISSTNHHKVKIVDEERDQLVVAIGGFGCGLPDLCYPHGVCVDSRNNVYIADTGNFRVVKYDSSGGFISCPVVETWNYGYDVKPTNVAVMRNGRLLVAMQGKRYCKIHVYVPKVEQSDCEDCDCSCFRCCAWSCCHCCSDYEPLK